MHYRSITPELLALDRLLRNHYLEESQPIFGMCPEKQATETFTCPVFHHTPGGFDPQQGCCIHYTTSHGGFTRRRERVQANTITAQWQNGLSGRSARCAWFQKA